MSTEEPQGGEVYTAGSANFDPLYAGKVRTEGLGMKFDFAPWNIPEPQPVVVALEASGAFRGKVLDAGCGTGQNSLHLKSRGHHVTGLDFSPSAIEQAQERARERGLDMTFAVSDATAFDGVEGGFETVLDYGLYHVLTDEQRRKYAAALHRVTAPGARLHLFAFAESELVGLPPQQLRVSKENFRVNLEGTGTWRILAIEDSLCTTNHTREYFEKQRAETGGTLPFDPDAFDVDAKGRIVYPMSYVHAERV
ncbi:class I SAM-dependent methyltransferase [Streptomyces sp. NPDC058301]|uniref:class I SAM-dependent methyltransferase n=1 Tax=Streptomyces sp. NPDC058301 TaxID=3346436 RepID=UPI0036E0C618